MYYDTHERESEDVYAIHTRPPPTRIWSILFLMVRPSPPSEKHTPPPPWHTYWLLGGDMQEGGPFLGWAMESTKRILTVRIHQSIVPPLKQNTMPPPYLKYWDFGSRPILLLYPQKGRSIHIGSPTLPDQIRHNNQPIVWFFFSFYFPWRWRPFHKRYSTGTAGDSGCDKDCRF